MFDVDYAEPGEDGALTVLAQGSGNRYLFEPTWGIEQQALQERWKAMEISIDRPPEAAIYGPPNPVAA
jgi:hypothetical protein